MDHATALRLRAAERYRTHELTPAERDAFEEHFFECPECAAAVRLEQAFAANARAALRDQVDNASGEPLRDRLGLKK